MSKLPLDPTPYWNLERDAGVRIWAPGFYFNPRPGYSQNIEDYQ